MLTFDMENRIAALEAEIADLRARLASLERGAGFAVQHLTSNTTARGRTLPEALERLAALLDQIAEENEK